MVNQKASLRKKLLFSLIEQVSKVQKKKESNKGSAKKNDEKCKKKEFHRTTKLKWMSI